ncbi:MAG TPA: PilW family protein [Rhodanobacteraceae bacterium]|nr:PilW family protein [Rhodanobacteraceae bacterium]
MISIVSRVSPRPRVSSAGFSLIEMMIAVVLGALVVAGLINVLMANRQAYHLQEANNYNQENMRFAMDRIGWSLRQASYWSGVHANQIIGTPAVGGTSGSCNQAWALDAKDAVFGYDGTSSGTGFPVKDCVDAANYVGGSDVLVVRYADADAVPWSATTVPTLNSKQIYLEARAGTYGVLFAGNYLKQLPFTDAAGAPQQGSYIYPYAIEMYYLRPCSDLGSATDCSAASDGGHPIPTLMRMRLDSTGTLINEPVVEGVEQLQFEYGLRNPADPNKSPTPVQYRDANGMAAGDWANVIAVRIGYVLRSQTRDTALPHPFDSQTTDVTNVKYPLRLSSDCEYSIAADGTAQIVSGCTGFNTSTSLGDKPQQYTRAQMNAVVQLRNLIRQI